MARDKTRNDGEARHGWQAWHTVGLTGVIVVCLICVVLLAFSSNSEDEAASGAQSATAEATTTTDNANTGTTDDADAAVFDSGCTDSEFIAGEASVLAAGQMQLANGMITVPTLDGVGPFVTDGGVSRCFAHSESGAVMAGANFIKWFTTMVDLETSADLLVYDDENKERLLTEIAEDWDGSTSEATLIRGYKITLEDEDEAYVTYLVTQAGYEDTEITFGLRMKWSEGSWLVLAPSGMTWDIGGTVTEWERSNYTLWSV